MPLVYTASLCRPPNVGDTAQLVSTLCIWRFGIARNEFTNVEDVKLSTSVVIHVRVMLFRSELWWSNEVGIRARGGIWDPYVDYCQFFSGILSTLTKIFWFRWESAVSLSLHCQNAGGYKHLQKKLNEEFSYFACLHITIFDIVEKFRIHNNMCTYRPFLVLLTQFFRLCGVIIM